MVGDLETALRALVSEVVRTELERALSPALKALENVRAHAGPSESAYLTPKEAANIARVNQRTILDWVAAGKLRRYQAGRLTRIKSAELHAYLERCGSADEVDDGADRAEEILAEISG